jgi:hypothetical protein
MPIKQTSGLAFRATVGGFALVASLVSSARAQVQQEYRSDPPDLKANHGAVATLSVNDPAKYAAERAKVDEYFEKFYFPSMTGTSPEELGRLGDWRFNLFKNYLRKTTNEQFQQQLTSKAYTASINILKAQNPPYHPAVRYNAVLILGLLDRQYGAEGSRPPEPLPQANKVLVAIVDSATTNDRFSPPVILGALVGLERHAQYRQSLAADDVNKMTAALLKLVNHDKPIQEMSPSAYAWLRLRAGSVLSLLRSVGTDNSIHSGLTKLAGDLKSLDDRCSAAALLGRIDYKDVKLQDPAAVEPLLKLARDLAEAEAKRAKEFQQEEIAGAGGGSVSVGVRPGGIYGGRESAYGYGARGGGDMLQEQEERFPRRHVLARLTDLKAGLEAVKPAVAPETQTKIDAILAAVKPVITQAIDKDTGELAFAGTVVAMASAIQTAVKPAQAPDAADEADSFEEFQTPVEPQPDEPPQQPEPQQPSTERPAAQQPEPEQQ